MDFLKMLRDRNLTRCARFGHQVDEWSETDWACAVAGEVGEMCNLIKKKRRGDRVCQEDIADEIADVVIYLDLLCAKIGIDLEEAIKEKFNQKSRERGFPERI